MPQVVSQKHKSGDWERDTEETSVAVTPGGVHAAPSDQQELEPALKSLEVAEPATQTQAADPPERPTQEPAREQPARPAADPADPGRGRSAAILVAGLAGALGLIFSVILAVGALTVAIGAGAGNAIYDPLSAVCDGLVGPLKDAFNFSGPNAASREEFLGWGAGSLIYLAVSFIGQAAHRAATRD